VSRVPRAAAWVDWPFVAALVLLALLPLVVPYTAIATMILIMSIFAIGYNLLLGYTGLMSFGHGAFYGVGAYAAGFTLLGGFSVWLAIAAAVVLAALAGLVIGYLSLRRSDIYFALLTLAFSQVLYFIALQARAYTGGDDGLIGIPVSRLLGFDLSQPFEMYYCALAFFALCSYVARRLVNAPFGKAMQAVRENEDRATACGYDTHGIKLTTFVISAAYGGVAGALLAIHIRFVPIDVLYWTMNGEVVFVSIVGGLGTFFGPVVGAVAFILLHDILQTVFERWELVVGAVLITFILFFKAGIVGTLAARLAARRRRAAGRQVAAPAAGGAGS
jgi:branched-chain amino acid transport system permease protein